MSAQLATERIWATADGRFVRDGHVDAAVLAAAEGDPVPDGFDGFDDVDQVETRKPTKRASAKVEAEPATKPED